MKQLTKLLYILALLRVILPFLLQDSFYQPHRDEFLYLAEGKHMAWGFMEIPPLLSVFAWLTNLFGGSMFWIKIWPALFGALTFILVGKIILSLSGKAFALVLGWLAFVVGAYGRIFFLFQPNFLEVFFWTFIAFSIIKHIQTEENKWLYVFGIAVGLGMMSKYSAAFYTGSILIGLLITRHRKLFLNKHLYYAGILAFIIFLPNLAWQYNHRFPVFYHMKELQDTQLQYTSRWSFIISQFMMNTPVVFVWIAGLYFVIFSAKGKPYRLFGWAYFFIIVFLLAMQGKDYYALGSYPVLFAFGAYQLESATRVRLRWVRYAMLGFAIMLGIYSMPLILPTAKPTFLANYYQRSGLIKTGSFIWEDQQRHTLPQDFADMIGWKEMTIKAAEVYGKISPEQQKHTLIYCGGYGAAGAINYYGKQYHLPEVYSANASFLWWMPEKYDVQTLLLIDDKMTDSTHPVFQNFATHAIVDSLNVPLARENGLKYIIMQGPSDKINAIFEKLVSGQKAKFLR